MTCTCSAGRLVLSCFEFVVLCRLSDYLNALWNFIPAEGMYVHLEEFPRYCFLDDVIISSYFFILSSKSMLASRLFSSSALFSRLLDSSAVFNWSASSVFSFNACCRLSTCVLSSKAACNPAANSFVCFSLSCNVSTCVSQLANNLILTSLFACSCSIFSLFILAFSCLAFNFFSSLFVFSF